MAELTISADDIQSAIEEYVDSFTSDTSREEVGTVIDAGDGIAHVEGLPSVMTQELLEFPGGVLGVALNLDEHSIGAVILGDFEKIAEGQQVKRTGEVLSVPVGDAFLGRVVNPLGQPIDGGGDIETETRRALELQAPSVVQRQSVKEPLQTGIKAIDAMTPIGRGQRQLIIGDRKTGKTTVCVDTILNQRQNWETGDERKQVRCVYVAIGQKGTTIASVRRALEEGGAMDYTTIVAAPASDSAGFKWLAPYTGSAIAQHWMYEGKHVLIVFDDLTKQAEAYRAISLLLRRPPGREAYPGDVFYLHSRLLERCAKLSDELGAGSLTGLPIIETKANDISAYIPTNVISITDGQCFLETDLFNQGVRPAINVGVSVSRVGGAAQIKAMKEVAGCYDWTCRSTANWNPSRPLLPILMPRRRRNWNAVSGWSNCSSNRNTSRCRSRSRWSRSSWVPAATWTPCLSRTSGGSKPNCWTTCGLPKRKSSTRSATARSSRKKTRTQLVEIINHFKKGFAASDGGSVVPDEHVEAMDEKELAKESVQVKKEKPKDRRNPRTPEGQEVANNGCHTSRTTRPDSLGGVDQEDHQGPGDDRDVAHRQGPDPPRIRTALRIRDHLDAHHPVRRSRSGPSVAGRASGTEAGRRPGGVLGPRFVRRVQLEHLPSLRGAVLPARGRREKTPVLYTVGRKAHNYFKFRNWDITESWIGFLRATSVRERRRDRIDVGRDVHEGHRRRRRSAADGDQGVDELHIVYSEFKSMMSQTAVAHRIAPLVVEYVEEEQDRTPCTPSSRMRRRCSRRCCRGT